LSTQAAGKPPQIGCHIIKSDTGNYDNRIIAKSSIPEQLTQAEQEASDWIQKPLYQEGLKELVSHSSILPQCIRAYKNNIAGFGLKVAYKNDYEEETEEMKQEFSQMKRIIELLNFEGDTKEVFENVITARETYGIAYIECIRNLEGKVVEIDFIKDTPSIEMSKPLEPAQDIIYYYNGEPIIRKKKFRKYKQTIAGKTVYFKEFGDPRIMDKRTGEYVAGIDDFLQSNEILEFALGTEPYGEVRWIGQIIGVDGARKAEGLNNNYFTNGRHTPLMIIVKGGTLTDDSFEKLQSYINGIKGENGQHAFLIMEVENSEPTTALTDVKQPEVEIKEMASILQKDELFQGYQDNTRRRNQSAFQLPDLYVAYTTDFNRATAQTAMEVTEKQVFQPERVSLAWQINNKLLNEYGFKHCEVRFEAPDITNPDDITKILNITERAGGMTPNIAKDLTYDTLGKDAENYTEEWGDIPLKVFDKLNTNAEPVNQQIVQQLDQKIEKAISNQDDSIVSIMKEVRRLLLDRKDEAVI